ncbi:class E sortase [Candidatus Daviesbacteria bacterium]|nr:class E sortase [Candidatus Daviesbacteria bacterium]
MIATGKLVSLFFLSAGVFFLMQLILPFVSFQLWNVLQDYSNSLLISPQPQKNSAVLGVSVSNYDNFPAFVSNLNRPLAPPYSYFNVTVPRLNLENSPVEVESNDLSRGLVHLPGTALPGEKGNVFVSGHSAVPLFSAFKGSAVFANLTNIKKGDQIIVEAGGAKFIYQVEQIKIVEPGDLSVVLPPDGIGRYISLMTCVPPGLNTKRLIVLGKMI